MIMRARGDKSPKNLRDSVEEIQNRLGNALELQELEWKRNKRPRARSQTCPVYQICPIQRLDMSSPN
jgi:hypothetical protein